MSMNFTILTYGNSLFSSTKGKIAWITECISKPRSLNELCRFSLIRKIVPILKSRLDFSDADMSGFIEFAVYYTTFLNIKQYFFVNLFPERYIQKRRKY